MLKGLHDKISCPDIIHKCTSKVHIFFITFKLRDRGDDIGFDIRIFFLSLFQLRRIEMVTDLRISY